MTPDSIVEQSRRAYEDGYEAGYLGESRACPYIYSTRRVLEAQWNSGFADGEKDLLESEKEHPMPDQLTEACVNALAGRDPSKLAELENAVEFVCQYFKRRNASQPDTMFDDEHEAWTVALKALAAFRKEAA